MKNADFSMLFLCVSNSNHTSYNFTANNSRQWQRREKNNFIKFLPLNISLLTWPRFKTHRGIHYCFLQVCVSRQRAEITRRGKSAARSDQSRACCDTVCDSGDLTLRWATVCLDAVAVCSAAIQPIFGITKTISFSERFLNLNWPTVMCFSYTATNKGKRAVPKSNVHFLSFISLDSHLRTLSWLLWGRVRLWLTFKHIRSTRH